MNPISQSKLMSSIVLQFLIASLLCTTIAISSYNIGRKPNFIPYYDPNEALMLMKIVGAGYAQNSTKCLANINKKLGTDWSRVVHDVVICVPPIDKCTVFVVKSERKRQFIAAFRGTSSAFELIHELVSTLEPEKRFLGGRVHSYFHTAFQNLWPTIDQTLRRDVRTRDWPVVFSGMSLGGALAAMSAAFTVQTGLRRSHQVSLRSFGQPRVGDARFAARFDALVADAWRVVSRADLVPHLPPCHASGAACARRRRRHYFHHGREVWYPWGCGADRDYRICAADDEDPNCSDSLTTYSPFDHIGGYFLNAGNFANADCIDDF